MIGMIVNMKECFSKKLIAKLTLGWEIKDKLLL